MLKKSLLGIAMLLTFNIAFSQETERSCSTMEVMNRLIQEDPSYLTRMEAIESFTENYVAQNAGSARTVITIPVVVHVVYNTAAENISDAAIYSQIEILNEDFRKLNSDAGSVPALFSGVAADAEIEFCLATVDPSGNPTTGITRKSTTKTSFTTSDQMKYNTYGTAAWDRDSYLNLWVCDLSSGLLGYAQFPGGAAATDGVVIDYAYFGGPAYATSPFNLGRTATHEVGHWLNLRHIWGDATCGDDLVGDTPKHNTANYGCPSYPHYSTCTGTPVEMTMNYMDYTDDACMYMFSAGQKDRMQALFASGGARESILSSAGCGGGGGTPTCSTPTGTSTTSITETSATLNWGSVAGAAGYNVRGRQVGSATWTTASTTGTSINYTGLTAGTNYEWQVQTDCGGGSLSSFTGSITFTTSGGAATCTDFGESNNTSGTAKVVTPGTYSALIANSTDKDYYKFTTSSPNTKIKITLTSLPADYDVRLYDQSLKQKGISQNGGTSDETIIWNTNAANTRYVYVYGYGGAFDASDCYDMTIQVSNTSFKTDGTELFITDEWDNAIVSIYPNPASNDVNVNYYSVQETGVTMKVYDLLGNMVNTVALNVTEGQNIIPMDVRSLSAGIYVVEISNGKSNYTDKFIVE